MKKIIVYLLLIFVFLWSFNLNVFAQEIDTNTTDINNQEEIIDNSLNEINEDEIDENNIENEEDVNDELQNQDENLEESDEDLDVAENPNETSDDEVQVQRTKVLISKENEKGELLVGSKLQILNSNGEVIHEWITDGTIHEVMLGAGKYILHEVLPVEGYELSPDQEFEVEVIVEDEIIGNANMSEIPCNHGEDNLTPMYYVEVNNVTYEVYCINQGLATPDGIEYNGQIVTPEDLRNFTKQETNIDTEGYTISGTRINVNTETVPDYDVSDQTLTDEELYNKVLDIIYHRLKAEKDERFKSLSIEEIRFITEVALKNYLNARITTYETVRELVGTTIKHLNYNEDGELWETGDGTKYIKLYNKYYNREYLFDETSPTGYIIVAGEGNSLGNLAKHWYGSHNKEKLPTVYAELFYYLIGDESKHPEDMKLYMYSPTAVSRNIVYQNLLGITGFLDDVEIREQSLKMLNEYSDETRDIPVEKVWEDELYDESERPESVTVNLYADGQLQESVELNKENEWSYVFEDLAVYNEGNKIIYTIDEVQVEKYETTITGDMETGFTITNTHYGEGSPVPPPEIENPETSDNINNNIIMLIIGILGLLSLPVFIKAE